MASLKDLASRVKEYLTPKPLVSPIVGQQPVKKTFANDNEGWIRQGRFTPIKNISEKVTSTQPYKNLSTSLDILTNPSQTANRNLLIQGLQIPEPGRAPAAQKAINFLTNVAAMQTGGIRDIRSGVEAFKNKKYLQSVVKPAFGVAKIATSGLPPSLVANLLSSNTKPIAGDKYDLTRRLSSGYLSGMSGENLGTNVADKNIKVLGSEFDPVKGVGSLAGFTKNPLWSTIFGKTQLINKFAPATKGVLQFIASRGVKGGVEGWIQALNDVPVNADNKTKADIFLKNIAFGAASEIVTDAGSIALKNLISKLTPQAKQQLGNAITESQKNNKKVKFVSPSGEVVYENQKPTIFEQGQYLNQQIEKNIPGADQGFGNIAKPVGGNDAVMNAEISKGLTPEVTTKATKTPQLGMQPETSTVLPKTISGELQTKPSPELQTVQIKGKASQQSQPFESIIQEAKKQIGKTQEPKDQTFKQTLDNLYTQWVDRYNPIVKASKTTKEWLKTKGATLRPENDPEYLVRRLTGAGGIADYRFRTELDPVIKQAESLGIDKGDLDVYLANRRMAGFGQVGRDIYGADPKKSSQIVSALEGKYGENIKNIADQLYSYQNKGFQEMVDAGFISPESAKVIQSQNPDYSPLYRVMDEVDDYLGLPTRKTMQGSQPIAKIKGSTKQIESPLESVIGNTFRQRAAIEKNRVAQSIVDLQTITDLGFKKVSKSSPDTVTVWRNGQKEYWNVGKDIAETARGVNEEQMNVVLKVLQAPASLLRQGATGRNPEFMIPNIVRDQLDAGITSKYGYIPFVDYVSGLKSMLGNDDIYQKWQSSGAKIDLGELGGKKSISKLFDEKTAKKGLFNWLGEGLDFLGQYSEVPTRVGLFKKAYKKTGNELIAALESRDATVDFARMGSKMKVANSIIPFLNVGVQGFDKLVRSIKNNPSKLAFNMALYGATPAIATTLYNLQNHPEEYAEIPQYEKDDNFIIVKGRNENGNVNYIKIPKGNILPVISNPIENFLAFASGQDTQSIGKLSLNLFGDLLPVVESGGSVKEVLTKTIGSNIPQAFKPAAETLLNKSFYKYDPNKEQSKDIVPSYLQKREPYQQYYEWTPKLYQKIGALVNASPLKVQNLAEGYLAGFAKIPANIVEIMSKVPRGEEVRPNEKPLIRRFFGETNPSSAKPAEKTPATPLMERVTGKVGASETTPKVLSETQKESLKWKFKSSGQEAQQVADGMYFVKGSDGDANFIDISQEIPEPKYSGVESIDKKLKSQYKGDLTRRGNNIIKLYEKGQINEEQAKALLDEVEIKYDSTLAPKKPKKPKSIKIRSVKYSTPKLTKTARKSAPKISISTVKLPKSVKRNITISKPKQISVKGFKNTLSSSVKLA